VEKVTLLLQNACLGDSTLTPTLSLGGQMLQLGNPLPQQLQRRRPMIRLIFRRGIRVLTRRLPFPDHPCLRRQDQRRLTDVGRCSCGIKLAC
jgi:hypothetical protein